MLVGRQRYYFPRRGPRPSGRHDVERLPAARQGVEARHGSPPKHQLPLRGRWRRKCGRLRVAEPRPHVRVALPHDVVLHFQKVPRRYNGNETWRALDELGFPDDASVSHTGGWLLIDPRSPIDVGGRTYAAGSYLAVQYDDVIQNGLKGAKCRAFFEPTPTTSLARPSRRPRTGSSSRSGTTCSADDLPRRGDL